MASALQVVCKPVSAKGSVLVIPTTVAIFTGLTYHSTLRLPLAESLVDELTPIDQWRASMYNMISPLPERQLAF